MTFKEFQHQYIKNEVSFEYFGGFECDNQNYVKAQEDLFSQALADERRKFAEWLMKSKYIFVGRDGFTHNFHEKTVSLDEVLAEYEKEQR